MIDLRTIRGITASVYSISGLHWSRRLNLKGNTRLKGSIDSTHCYGIDIAPAYHDEKLIVILARSRLVVLLSYHYLYLDHTLPSPDSR